MFYVYNSSYNIVYFSDLIYSTSLCICFPFIITLQNDTIWKSVFVQNYHRLLLLIGQCHSIDVHLQNVKLNNSIVYEYTDHVLYSVHILHFTVKAGAIWNISNFSFFIY